MDRRLSSDQQVIDGVRRWQRYRRPVGAVCALLGVLAVVSVLYWTADLRRKSLALYDQLGPAGTARNPTTRQVEQVLGQSRFDSGVALGFLLAEGLTGGASLAVAGVLWVLVHDRKDRLLLKCWDERPEEP